MEENTADVITVAVVNFHARWGNKSANLNQIRTYAKAAAKTGAELVVFPELALTGYDIDDENSGDSRMQIKNAEPIPGPSTGALSEISEKYGIYIVFGMPEKKDGAVYNSVAVVRPGTSALSYQKIHPFGDENTWCSKGSSPLIVDTKWGKIGIGICYDTYQFPELLRYYAAMGCRLYLNCTAQCEDPAEPRGQEWFQQYYLSTLTAAVVTNELFIASANLTGWDKTTYFGGASMIIGPGVRPAAAPGDPIYNIYAGNTDDKKPGTVIATLDLSLAKRSLYEKNPITNTPDFRPELYAKLYDELSKLYKETQNA